MQKWTNSNERTIHINILLFDAFSNLCLANALEPLRAANSLLNRPAYSWEIYTMSGDTATSSSGIAVVPSAAFDPRAVCDRLFIVSSYHYKSVTTATLYKALRQAKSNSASIIGFDTGAWLMASAGLLKRKKATIHWDVIASFEEMFLDTNVVSEPYVIDGAVGTCGGAMATFDLVLDLISSDHGAAVKFDVARLFRREPTAQATPQLNQTLLTRRAMTLMCETIETPMTIGQLCSNLDCHPKTLEREFKREYGASAGRIYKRVRLTSIRELVETTNISMTEISVRCGYKSPSAMTRAFREEYGFAPRVLRSQRTR